MILSNEPMKAPHQM